LRRAANTYATIGAGSADTQPRRQVDAFAAFPMKSGSSLSAQYSYRQGLATGAQRRASLLGTVRLGRTMDMVTTASRVTEVRRTGYEVSSGVTVNLGGRLAASVSGVRDAQGNHAVLDVQRPLPVGTGVGYQLHTESGAQDSTSGVLQYQGEYGRYELRSEMVGTSQQSVVSAAGALVGIGGSVFATRPVRNSFALIKVPDVGGVRAFSSNQEIGRTSRHGNVLVPDLLPYYGNRLSIADSDIPIDYVVSEADVTLAPPYRGGAVVLFPVRLVQRSTGTIAVVRQGQEITPVYGQLVVHSGADDVESPIGTDGEFYLEGVSPGRHDASVTWGGGSCSFTIVVPAAKTPVGTLGRLRCTDDAPAR
jgi:outer membrane usher protein